jgi:hypothetical protein
MSITSNNAVAMLTVGSLFPNPVQLQDFATDDMFDVDNLPVTETMMGVDGILTGGRVIEPVVQRWMFMADSPSISIFETWKGAQDQIADVYSGNMTILMPSMGRKYTMVKGFLITYSVMPSARRVLQPRQFEIRWQSVSWAPATQSAQ